MKYILRISKYGKSHEFKFSTKDERDSFLNGLKSLFNDLEYEVYEKRADLDIDDRPFLELNQESKINRQVNVNSIVATYLEKFKQLAIEETLLREERKVQNTLKELFNDLGNYFIEIDRRKK